jgi:arylsulfate sulfotransferase
VSVQEVPPSTNGVVTLTSGNYSIATRVTGTQPVVTPTSHPLVYLYSIPPCGKNSVSVQFGYGANPQHYMSTPTCPCSSTKSSNFYIAGLKANTQYNIRAIYHTTTGTTRGPLSTVTTGAIPANMTFPAITEPVTVTSATDYAEPVIFHDTSGAPNGALNVHTFATDILGNMIWYFNDTYSQGSQYVDRPLPGGSVFALLGDRQGANQLVRAMDLVGNPVQET